jgi:hypothetical protein
MRIKRAGIERERERMMISRTVKIDGWMNRQTGKQANRRQRGGERGMKREEGGGQKQEEGKIERGWGG